MLHECRADILAHYILEIRCENETHLIRLALETIQSENVYLYHNGSISYLILGGEKNCAIIVVPTPRPHSSRNRTQRWHLIEYRTLGTC